MKRMKKLVLLLAACMLAALPVKASQAEEIHTEENRQQSSQNTLEGWVEAGGKMYFFRDGKRVGGWVRDDGNWYYMDTVTGVMKKKAWIVWRGNRYYLQEDGTLAMNQWFGSSYVGRTGALAVRQWVGKYYLNSKGKIAFENKKSEVVQKYFADNKLTGWAGQGDDWKYFVRGRFVIGWYKLNGHWYNFSSDGSLNTGAYLYRGNEYYLNPTPGNAYGRMVTGWFKIDGVYHYFLSHRNHGKECQASVNQRKGVRVRRQRSMYKHVHAERKHGRRR